MSLTDDLPGPVAPATEQDQVDGVRATVVARPESTTQTAALLAACHSAGLAVVARGRGTKLTWGAPPERVDVILDTTAMDDLVEHARGDLIATAGAGMPLATFQERLAEGGHQLALDDLTTRGGTLGGAMMTNLSGPRRMWAGTLRDLVIGVRFVRADGTVAKAGGKVVKNVAGYDLSKLLTGSFGTLAVVTEITVRLHPLPVASRWVQVTPGAGLATTLAQAIASQLVPSAVEVRSTPGDDPLVCILVEGTGAQARAEALAAQLGSAAQVTEHPPAWWGALPTTADPDPPHALLRATARLSGIPDLVAALTAAGAVVSGSAGAGVLHAALPVAEGGTGLGRDLAAVRAVCAAQGGSAVVLDAPPEYKATLDLWGPVPAWELMRRVKDEFDPARVLSPGRFVGGL